MKAVAAQIAGFRTLVDGSARVSVDLPLEHVERWLMEVGTSVALAHIEDKSGAVQSHDAGATLPPASDAPRHPFGQQAKTLRQSGFFRAPEVWRRLGPDADFLSWLAIQPCAASEFGNCEGDVVAAHVRRIANGAGTGIKPDYSAIPLCHRHHSLQHQNGETALWPRETWDLLRIQYIEDWAWAKLKALFNVAHMYDLNPKLLWEWAAEREIAHYLPMIYREAQE